MGKGNHGRVSSKGRDEEEEAYSAPPDGGWGWMVVASSFLIHVIADGIVYSFGVFLVVFVDYFNSGRGETSWVGSLQPAVTFTVGPLASALTNHFGCRAVTIAGAIIAAAGFILSVFTPNLYFLYFSSGIMAGLGFGLIYLPAIVSVAQYFEKKRSFAMGLAVCGSGFGTFIMAPLTEVLLQEFSWRGALLILGGIILNVVVCGVIFRPLENPPAPEQKAPEKRMDVVSIRNIHEVELLLDNNLNTEYCQQGDQEQHKKLEDIENSNLVAVGSVMNQKPKLISNSHHHLSPPSNGYAPNDIASIAKSDGALHHLNKPDPQGHNLSRRLSGHRTAHSAARPVGRKDVFYSGSLQNIPMFRSDHDMYITSIISLPDALEGTDEGSKCCGFTVPSEFNRALREMMDFSLLNNPVFLMFAISNFFTSIGFNMPFIFLPDRAKLSGIDEIRAAWLLSAIGIANTLGRVLFGFLADLKWVNRLILYNTALTICGVATALSPFVGGNYELLMIYAVVFGIFIGVYVSLTSVVLVDLLGIDLLTNSFGLLLLFQGAATFIGPPLAGWMCDWTGSYDISFNVMGSLIAASGAMLFFLPIVQKHYEHKMPTDVIVHQIDMGALTVDPDPRREASAEMMPDLRKTSL